MLEVMLELPLEMDEILFVSKVVFTYDFFKR